MQKVVPPEGDTIHGRFVPGGTRIGHCTWGVLRHKGTFGSDAHVYRPERWLEASEEKVAEMTRAADLLFGSGRYACLGKTVAFLELRKCLATVCLYLFSHPSLPFLGDWSVLRSVLFADWL